MKRLLRRLCATACVCAMLVTSAAALSVEDALTLLEEHYVNELPAAAYQAKTLDELFDAVGDPYTYYMTAEEYQAFLDGVEDEDSVTGIGAQISYEENGILIAAILPGGGAEEVGLVAGDLIIAVNGESCVPAEESDRTMITGEAGTSVRVTVKREDGNVQDYTIERRSVPIHNTLVTIKDGVGRIDCDSFATQTGTYFADGIGKYDDQAHLWVVDLRSNTGGVTSAAISALGAFTGAGPQLYLRDRSGQLLKSYYFDNYLTEAPAVVLMDRYSASASEIFAGGIRAYRAGISVGSRSFGKGVAQLVFSKSNSPCFVGDDAVKLTAYRFYLADGNTSDRIGIIPTLLVPADCTEEIVQLLSEKKPSSPDGYLRLTLAGWDFYVDLENAQSEAHRSAFATLISVLAPDAKIALGHGSGWTSVTVAMARTLYADNAPDHWFTDLDGCSYAREINTLGTYGLLLGNGDGKFRPNAPMTRAEVCTMLARALNVTTTVGGYFTDFEDFRWYAGSVNAMAMLGLVNGVGNGRFDPHGTMTQEQFITVMCRLAAFLNCNVSSYYDGLDKHTLDTDPELAAFRSWSRGYVKTLSSCLRTADEDAAGMLFAEPSALSPLAPITRGEAAATMYNVLTKLGILVY